MQITRHSTVYEVFQSTGFASVQSFRREFQALHENTPIRAAKLFLYYVGTRGIDALSESMAFWSTSGTIYISLLLEMEPEATDNLSTEIATQAISRLGALDPQFLFKFSRSAGALKTHAAILRALSLVPALGDYSILIPWLRTLGQNPDSHLRARSTKLLCQLRPNKALIEKHLNSTDARIRAGVMEALWNPKAINQQQDLLPVLQAALDDANHRVVANALVGLHRLGDSGALPKMMTMSSHKNHLFRAAMAWAMGIADDPRAIPTLQLLTQDRSFTVRKRASDSVLALTTSNTPTVPRAANPAEVVDAEIVSETPVPRSQRLLTQ